jgi:phage terminase large subunit
MSTQAFNWKHPDYAAVYAERAERLEVLRAHPESLTPLRQYYSQHIAEFINDWGMTSDPRNRNKGVPVETPFLLFDQQKLMVDYIAGRMANREPGLIEKSRDCGASWLAMCIASSLCLFGRGVVVGVGSRTEDKVDRTGDPDCLLWKARFFLKNLPPEFRGGWDETRHSAHMRLQFPETGSAIVGEAGDAIGRGGRSTLYIIDEAAFIERPQLIEASLASNTDCRVDISTPNGRANSFATKRHSGRIKVFTFPWRADPRKDQAWYEKQCEILDPVTRAQEIDLSYDASVEGILIPAEWIHAAIGAHTRLGIEPKGARRGALDVADEGKDKNCFAGRHGVLLERLRSWSGKGSDIFDTTVKAFALCEENQYSAFDFDSDGLGAGCRGDSLQVNLKRREAGKHEIEATPFRGSAAVHDPEASLVEGRLNKDYFQNLKSQVWWALRLRYQNTYRAVVEGMPFDPDSIISIDPDLDELNNLVSELSQPTYSINAAGKVLIDKVPEGAASPNRADSVMILFNPFRTGAYFSTSSAATSEVSPGKSYSMPKLRMDHLFAVVQFIDDVAGVVYCAANPTDADGTRTEACGGSFFVLDYDLRVLDATAEDWLWSVEAKLKGMHTPICGGPQWKPPTLFCDDLEEGYAEVLANRGLPVQPVADLVAKDEPFPPILERLKKARPYISMGRVTIAPAAGARTLTFRGVSRNFLREVLDQADVPATNALAIALATAVLINFRGEVALPPRRPVSAEDTPPPMPAGPGPYVMLRPGTHVIDGATVNVAGDPGDLVMYPISPGRHLIDFKITYAIIPGAGIPYGAALNFSE